MTREFSLRRPETRPSETDSTPADRSAPSSPKALTLLLLSQQPVCDLAPAELFPPDTLASLFTSEESEEGSAEPPSLLAALVITEVGASMPYVSAQIFAEGASSTPIVSDAWLALALALRYKPFGARLFITGGCLAHGAHHALRVSDARKHFPLLVTAAEVREQGNAAFDALRRAFPTKD